MVEYTKEELMIIQEVFHNLVHEGLERWTQLIPKEGEPRSDECNKIWRITGEYNEIRRKAAVSLGLEEEITDEDVDKILKEYNFPRKP